MVQQLELLIRERGLRRRKVAHCSKVMELAGNSVVEGTL